MKFLVLSIISSIALSSQFAWGQQPASGADIDGLYTGVIKINNFPDVPLELSLHITEQEIAGDSDEMFSEKKFVQGAFILDNESDPLTFTVADYQVDDGRFDLQYNRLGSIGTSGSVVSLRFQGTLNKDGSISGRVISGLVGPLGTFLVTRKSKDISSLIPKPKYIGHYVGTLNLAQRNSKGPKVAPAQALDIIIANVGGASTTNPGNIEVGTTPGRVGNFYKSDTPVLGFSSIVIDYLRHHITLIFTNLNAASTIAGGTVTLDGTLDGDTIVGFMSSTGNGLVGSFSVKKVTP